MYEIDDLINLFFENVKKLLYPQNWLQIDLQFSKSEIFAMLLINKNGEITMTELADYINSPMSTANGIIERLVKKGYIIRDRSDFDRRIVILRLTEEGAQLIDSLKEHITKYLKMVLEELSDEEIQLMVGIIYKIIHVLQNKFSAEASLKPDDNIRSIIIE